jgi:hypothetical protein
VAVAGVAAAVAVAAAAAVVAAVVAAVAAVVAVVAGVAALAGGTGPGLVVGRTGEEGATNPLSGVWKPPGTVRGSSRP